MPAKSHGERANRTKEYRAWCSIKDRCYNPNVSNYPIYGGKGIKMYEDWIHNYEAFLAYVGRSPSPKHSIDRFPNCKGNYVPGNLRWGTPKEQQNNRSVTIFVEYKGEKKTLKEVSEFCGMKYHTLWVRVIKKGMELQEAIKKSTSRNTNGVIVLDTQAGIFYESISEAAAAKGINQSNLRLFLRRPDLNKTSLIAV